MTNDEDDTDSIASIRVTAAVSATAAPWALSPPFGRIGPANGGMRWTLGIAAVLAVLLLAYAIWPVVGFFWVASTIEARDAAALAKLVDFRALRFRAQERLADIWVSEYGFATTTSIC